MLAAVNVTHVGRAIYAVSRRRADFWFANSAREETKRRDRRDRGVAGEKRRVFVPSQILLLAKNDDSRLLINSIRTFERGSAELLCM